jgi:hypothetical protein
MEHFVRTFTGMRQSPSLILDLVPESVFDCCRHFSCVFHSFLISRTQL